MLNTNIIPTRETPNQQTVIDAVTSQTTVFRVTSTLPHMPTEGSDEEWAAGDNRTTLVLDDTNLTRSQRRRRLGQLEMVTNVAPPSPPPEEPSGPISRRGSSDAKSTSTSNKVLLHLKGSQCQLLLNQ